MKTPKTLTRPRSHHHIPKAHAALALILIGLSPVIVHGQESSLNPDVIHAQTRANSAEMEAKAQKAQLDALDHQIDVIETHIELLPEGVERNQARQRLEALKDRRTELRKAYLSSKYEQLKADVQAEYEKAAAWTRQKYQNAKESIRGSDAETPAQAGARVNPETETAISPAPVPQDNPSSEITPEEKAAVQALDMEITRLKQHARSLPQGERRTILERRLEAIEDRKDELEKNFTQARWEALVADLKRERNELTR